MIHKILGDIRNILELAKVEKPKRIKLLVSEKWKYSLFKNIQKELEKTRNIGEIIKKVLVKGKEKEIGKIVPMLLKDLSKMPEVITSQQDEIKALKEEKNFLEQEFKTKIEIIKAEDSKEAKAKQAMPGKPAILVE